MENNATSPFDVFARGIAEDVQVVLAREILLLQSLGWPDLYQLTTHRLLLTPDFTIFAPRTRFAFCQCAPHSYIAKNAAPDFLPPVDWIAGLLAPETHNTTHNTSQITINNWIPPVGG